MDRINRIYRIPKFGEIPNTKPNLSIFSSWFPSLGIPRLDLEYRRWNTYVGHLNSYLGIPMSNVGIPTWVFSFLPRFLPNLMIFQCTVSTQILRHSWLELHLTIFWPKVLFRKISPEVKKLKVSLWPIGPYLLIM